MAWVFESINKKFTNFQQITNEKKELINGQISVVNKLMKYNELFTEFKKAYEEYLNAADGTDTSKTKDLVRYIKNFLTSYKGYIDGMETVLSRTFDKQVYESFKEFQRNAYDNNFTYRFIYNLRNYAQHCGSPISNVKRSINEKTVLDLKVDRFLSEHTGMQKNFRKELENYPLDAVDVGVAIKSVFSIIIDMQNSIFNLMIEEEKDGFLKSSYNLIEFYNKNSKYKGILYISDDQDVENLKMLKKDESVRVSINITQIPHQLAEFVLKNISIEYIFKGRNIGQSKAFPVIYKTQTAIEIPKFMTGDMIVSYHGIKWVRVMESIGSAFKDGYDRYAAIYVPNGLSMDLYNGIANRFKDKIKD